MLVTRPGMRQPHCSLKEVGPETSASARSRNETIVLSLVIGVLVSLVTVAFILLTGRLAARMYPSGGAPWRRLLIPDGWKSLVTGFTLSRNISPTRAAVEFRRLKFALFINNGYISLTDRDREIPVLLGVARKRHRARARRTVGADRRWNQLR